MHMFTNSLTQLAWWKTLLTPNNYSHDKIPDLTGKVAIVTGANSGLGYATTVALAANGARVFLACRSRERAQEAIENARAEIKAKYPKAPTPQLEFLELDLNDMTKSSQAAQEFLKKGLPLHILVNNSGIMNCPYALSADGIETQFAVNHMGYVGLANVQKKKKKSGSYSHQLLYIAIDRSCFAFTFFSLATLCSLWVSSTESRSRSPPGS